MSRTQPQRGRWCSSRVGAGNQPRGIRRVAGPDCRWRDVHFSHRCSGSGAKTVTARETRRRASCWRTESTAWGNTSLRARRCAPPVACAPRRKPCDLRPPPLSAEVSGGETPLPTRARRRSLGRAAAGARGLFHQGRGLRAEPAQLARHRAVPPAPLHAPSLPVHPTPTHPVRVPRSAPPCIPPTHPARPAQAATPAPRGRRAGVRARRSALAGTPQRTVGLRRFVEDKTGKARLPRPASGTPRALCRVPAPRVGAGARGGGAARGGLSARARGGRRRGRW
jgi:hypothetical protein